MIEYNGKLYDCNTTEEAQAIENLVLNPPALSAQEIEEDNLFLLRSERNIRLSKTDWLASSDLTMTAEQIAYRQALRDITDSYSSLETVVWPTKP